MSMLTKTKRRFPWFGEDRDFWNTPLELLNIDFFNKAEVPAVNIKQTETDYTVELSMPGFEKDDIQIDIEQGLLHIAAETRTETVEGEEDDYQRKEFSYQKVARSLRLPETVNMDATPEATLKNGLLCIVLPKLEGDLLNPKTRIPIK